jgi:hypothetical protein
VEEEQVLVVVRKGGRGGGSADDDVALQSLLEQLKLVFCFLTLRCIFTYSIFTWWSSCWSS